MATLFVFLSPQFGPYHCRDYYPCCDDDDDDDDGGGGCGGGGACKGIARAPVCVFVFFTRPVANHFQ